MFALLALGVTIVHVVLPLRHVPIVQGSDLHIYAIQFERSRYFGVMESMLQADRDAGFAGAMGLVAGAGLDFQIFWGLLVVVLTLSITRAMTTLVGLPRAALFVAFLPAWFPFVNYGTNTLRQGLAASLVILALAMKGDDARWPRLAVLWSACLVHWSALVPAVLLTLYFWLRPSRRRLWLVVAGSIIMFVTGANALLLGSVTGVHELSRTYTTQSAFGLYGEDGNRLDFLAFTCALIFVAVALERLTKQINPALDVFLVLCIGYFLFGFIAFSDRMASFAWIYWPVVLAVGVTRRRRPPEAASSRVAIGGLKYAA